MLENTSTEKSELHPQIPNNISKTLLKHERIKTITFLGVFGLFLAIMVVVNGVFNNRYEIEAFPAFIIFMLMLITTVESIFIRLGNVIAGHKFYKAWLIYPITNIIVLSLILTFLNIKFPDDFTFNNVGFFIGCLMSSMVFINSACIVRRDKPKFYELSLIYDDFDSKKVFMEKKPMIIYRIVFGSLTLFCFAFLNLMYS